MKKQLIYIHGGEVFDTYEDYINHLKNCPINLSFEKVKRWSHSLVEDLGNNFEIIAPMMPSKNNSKYSEWKIWFEKFFPFLQKEIILLGWSLGGIFLVKYLAENKLPSKIKALFLVAAPFNDTPLSLADFKFRDNVENIDNQAEKIFIYHSKNDEIVNFSNVEKYKQALPKSEMKIFEDRGHFLQEKFPELIEEIKKL